VRECVADAADGVVADYIPQLSHADPHLFGLALESREGDAYAVGEAIR
jgi:glutaminase